MNIADVAQHVHALEKKVKEQADEIEKLQDELEIAYAASRSEDIDEIERLRKALTKLEEDLWNMTNAVDDGDWHGEVPIFGKVVAHKIEYHKLHVDRLEKMARFARSSIQQKGDE